MENSEQIVRETKPSLWWLYAAWVIALLGMVGSLFFSEVMQYPPCALCWYQRIALYPLVFVIGAGIILEDVRVKYYGLPLCLAGLATAVYHNLVYYGVIPESLTPCSQGVSCADTQLELFGFITIPLLSLGAFAVLALCLWFYKSKDVTAK